MEMTGQKKRLFEKQPRLKFLDKLLYCANNFNAVSFLSIPAG